MMNARMLGLILFACLTASAGVVVALDCAGGPREQVRYSIASVEIDGETADADDVLLSEMLTISANPGGLSVQLNDDSYVSMEGP